METKFDGYESEWLKQTHATNSGCSRKEVLEEWQLVKNNFYYDRDHFLRDNISVIIHDALEDKFLNEDGEFLIRLFFATASAGSYYSRIKERFDKLIQSVKADDIPAWYLKLLKTDIFSAQCEEWENIHNSAQIEWIRKIERVFVDQNRKLLLEILSVK